MSVHAKFLNVLAITWGLWAAPSAASQTDIGTIYNVLGANTSRAFFEQTGTRTARPACATYTRWVLDTSTDSGKAMFAQALTAWSLGRQVYISGTGNCALWGDSESVAGIQTAN